MFGIRPAHRWMLSEVESAIIVNMRLGLTLGYQHRDPREFVQMATGGYDSVGLL